MSVTRRLPIPLWCLTTIVTSSGSTPPRAELRICECAIGQAFARGVEESTVRADYRQMPKIATIRAVRRHPVGATDHKGNGDHHVQEVLRGNGGPCCSRCRHF